MILLYAIACILAKLALGIVEDGLVIVGLRRRGSMARTWWAKR